MWQHKISKKLTSVCYRLDIPRNNGYWYDLTISPNAVTLSGDTGELSLFFVRGKRTDIIDNIRLCAYRSIDHLYRYLPADSQKQKLSEHKIKQWLQDEYDASVIGGGFTPAIYEILAVYADFPGPTQADLPELLELYYTDSLEGYVVDNDIDGIYQHIAGMGVDDLNLAIIADPCPSVIKRLDLIKQGCQQIMAHENRVWRRICRFVGGVS